MAKKKTTKKKPAAKKPAKQARPKKKPAAAATESTANIPPARLLTHITADLRPLAVPIDSIQPNPRNPNQHDARSVAAIAESFKKFGQRKPLVVNRRNGEIEAGHGGLEAGKALGWKYIAVVRVDDDPASQSGFTIADNRTAELSTMDDVLLAAMIADFAAEDGYDSLSDALLLAELLPAAPAETENVAFEKSKKLRVVVECETKAQRAKLIERLTDEGFHCTI